MQNIQKRKLVICSMLPRRSHVGWWFIALMLEIWSWPTSVHQALCGQAFCWLIHPTIQYVDTFLSWKCNKWPIPGDQFFAEKKHKKFKIIQYLSIIKYFYNKTQQFFMNLRWEAFCWQISPYVDIRLCLDTLLAFWKYNIKSDELFTYKYNNTKKYFWIQYF